VQLGVAPDGYASADLGKPIPQTSMESVNPAIAIIGMGKANEDIVGETFYVRHFLQGARLGLFSSYEVPGSALDEFPR